MRIRFCARQITKKVQQELCASNPNYDRVLLTTFMKSDKSDRVLYCDSHEFRYIENESLYLRPVNSPANESFDLEDETKVPIIFPILVLPFPDKKTLENLLPTPNDQEERYTFASWHCPITLSPGPFPLTDDDKDNIQIIKSSSAIFRERDSLLGKGFFEIRRAKDET